MLSTSASPLECEIRINQQSTGRKIYFFCVFSPQIYLLTVCNFQVEIMFWTRTSKITVYFLFFQIMLIHIYLLPQKHDGSHEKYRDRSMDFFFPTAPVSIGWTCLINSILNCILKYVRERHKTIRILHKTAITKAYGLQV